MNNAVDEIRSAVLSRHPLLYLQTPEEARVLEALDTLAAEMGNGAKVSTWTCVTGLDSKGGDTCDPVKAIQAILASPSLGFYVMKDLSEFIERPDVVRALRDAYLAFAGEAKTHIVITSPLLTIPDMLSKEMCLIEVPFPSAEEFIEHLLKVQESYPGMVIPEDLHPEIALALRGLTLNEAGHVMHRVLGAGSVAETDILQQIFAEKELILRKAGFLEFIPTRMDVDMIGGLEILKDWAIKRQKLFTQDAVDAGMPIPRGILIMGVSGCGKSLSAKAISCLWRVPLFRLDMNLVFSGMYGSPEAAFHRALKGIESVAPAVLWIDEIENALGMTCESASTEQSLTFSSFLTWMQERPPLVFVAATANRIEALPAEVIRKGRFDEVFFCDLPTDNERTEIIKVHLRINEVDPEDFDIKRLLFSTKGWTGAEIEQAVIAARIDASQEDRKLNLEDILRHTARMVPLSTTMEEQIKAIRSWSYNRATRASKAPPRSMVPDA